MDAKSEISNLIHFSKALENGDTNTAISHILVASRELRSPSASYMNQGTLFCITMYLVVRQYYFR